MKKAIAVILALVLSFSTISLLSASGATYKKGDVTLDGSVRADDARKILRVSARLEGGWSELQKILGDMDDDTRISAADARLALRVSARLESETYIVIEEPSSDEPWSEEPTSDEPITDEPTSDEPVSEEPISDEPVSEEPSSDEPVSEEPISEEPSSEEPLSEEPVSEEPISEEPSSEEQSSEPEPVSEPESRIDASRAIVRSISARNYTGSPIEPDLLIEFKGKRLSLDKDYTAVYTDNVNAGTAQINITFIGKYCGSTVVEFTIRPISVASAIVTVAEKEYTYTGSEITPPVDVVSSSGQVFVRGTDYEVRYINNIKVGTATVRVSFTGNYTGRAEATFKIVPAPIEPVSEEPTSEEPVSEEPISEEPVSEEPVSEEPVSEEPISEPAGPVDASGAFVFPILAQRYTGSPIEPDMIVLFGGSELSRGTDYIATYRDNVNVGTASVDIEFIGGYIGSTSAQFVIQSRDASDAIVTPEAVEFTYTGFGIAPQADVTLEDGRLLTPGVDYEIQYYDNTEVGTATARIDFIGNYTGSVEFNFTIIPVAPPEPVSEEPVSEEPGSEEPASEEPVSEEPVSEEPVSEEPASEEPVSEEPVSEPAGPIDASGAIVDSIPEQDYSGELIEPDVIVTLDGQELVPGTDYTVAYSSNIDAGTASVDITFMGGYTGSAHAEFTIRALDASDAIVTPEARQFTYTGEEITPHADVTLPNGRLLTAGADYAIWYYDNVATGVATGHVEFCGNYTGDTEFTFIILPETTPPEPISEEPISIEPFSEEPISEEPVSEEPVSEEPVTEDPEPVYVAYNSLPNAIKARLEGKFGLEGILHSGSGDTQEMVYTDGTNIKASMDGASLGIPAVTSMMIKEVSGLLGKSKKIYLIKDASKQYAEIDEALLKLAGLSMSDLGDYDFSLLSDIGGKTAKALYEKRTMNGIEHDCYTITCTDGSALRFYMKDGKLCFIAMLTKTQALAAYYEITKFTAYPGSSAFNVPSGYTKVKITSFI